MVIALTVLHVAVCFFLVVVVLLQSGKAADLAGAFGGMGSQTVFGPRGSATMLSRATTIAAAIFMISSLSLSIIASRAGTGGTLLDKAKHAPVQTGVPQPGSTVPLQATPSVDGKQLPTQTVPVPVIANPNAKQPTQKK